MSLPAPWVDKIFAKLTLVYGREFLGRWEGVSLADVKTDWGHELGVFEDWPEAIAYVLQNLPAGRAPTVQDFKALALKAPSPKRVELPAPAADPARLAGELSKLAPLRAELAAGGFDSKAWARRVLARHEAGDKVTPCSLRFARQALGMAAAVEAA